MLKVCPVLIQCVRFDDTLVLLDQWLVVLRATA